MPAGIMAQQGDELNGIVCPFLTKLNVVPFKQRIKPFNRLLYEFPYQNLTVPDIGRILIIPFIVSHGLLS